MLTMKQDLEINFFDVSDLGVPFFSPLTNFFFNDYSDLKFHNAAQKLVSFTDLSEQKQKASGLYFKLTKQQMRYSFRSILTQSHFSL